MNGNKIIGEAQYLNKSNGDYIPFRIKMTNTNCHKIRPILNQTD